MSDAQTVSLSRRRRVKHLARRLARFAGAYGPAPVAGAVLGLSLPPFGFWVLAFAGSAALFWQCAGRSWRRRLLLGWLFGLGLYGVGLGWTTQFNLYGGLAVVLVEALAPAVAAALSPRGPGRLLALPGSMVLLEMLRSSWPFGGLPLGGAALGQVGGPLAYASRLGGPRLLVGLVWLGGSALGLAAMVLWRRLRRERMLAREPAGWRELTGTAPPVGVRSVPGAPLSRGLAAAAVAAAVVAGSAAWGTAAADGGASRAKLEVAAVQGGGVRGLRKAQVDPATVFEAQVAATEDLIATDPGRVRLVVWPEDVVALDEALRGSAAEAALSSLARSARSTLLAGVTEPAGPGRFRNEIVALSPQGKVVDVFEKVHRVPFGEYVPWRGLFEHLADLSAVPLDAVPGTGDGVLRTPAGPLGTMVSYEVFFADRGRLAVRHGARLLVVPTNTSSYSTAQVPTQEVAAARLQALAEGRDLVMSSPTGFSALIDHDGAVLARSDLGRREVERGVVSLRDGRTLFEHWGDTPVLVLAGVALLAGWLHALGTRRRA